MGSGFKGMHIFANQGQRVGVWFTSYRFVPLPAFHKSFKFLESSPSTCSTQERLDFLTMTPPIVFDFGKEADTIVIDGVRICIAV
jgi:hypothetical protein